MTRRSCRLLWSGALLLAEPRLPRRFSIPVRLPRDRYCQAALVNSVGISCSTPTTSRASRRWKWKTAWCGKSVSGDSGVDKTDYGGYRYDNQDHRGIRWLEQNVHAYDSLRPRSRRAEQAASVENPWRVRPGGTGSAPLTCTARICHRIGCPCGIDRWRQQLREKTGSRSGHGRRLGRLR